MKKQKDGNGKEQTMKASSNMNTPAAGLRHSSSIFPLPSLEQSEWTPSPPPGKSGIELLFHLPHTALAARPSPAQEIPLQPGCGTLGTRAALPAQKLIFLCKVPLDYRHEVALLPQTEIISFKKKGWAPSSEVVNYSEAIHTFLVSQNKFSHLLFQAEPSENDVTSGVSRMFREHRKLKINSATDQMWRTCALGCLFIQLVCQSHECCPKAAPPSPACVLAAPHPPAGGEPKIKLIKLFLISTPVCRSVRGHGIVLTMLSNTTTG